MSRNKLVSVIIPAYNAGTYLELALSSLLRQTYTNIEIIIVDDGSTDCSLELISDIKDDRIRILRQSNSGKSVAINAALSVAEGEYYAIQDADDLSLPTRIEQLVRYMEEESVLGGVFSGYNLLIGSSGFAPICPDKDPNICKNNIDMFQMPSHDPTGLYRMSHVKSIEYDPELRIGQGYDYILRVGEIFPLRVIPFCLYSYRVANGSTTRKNKERRVLMIKNVWEKACLRRGINYHEWCAKNQSRVRALQRGSSQYGVVSHCMESVYNQKQLDTRFLKILKTSLQCCMLNPLNFSNYKPLIYALLPLEFITFYRTKLKYN